MHSDLLRNTQYESHKKHMHSLFIVNDTNDPLMLMLQLPYDEALVML